ncbi:MAG: hypothetical protein M3R68_00640 [Acidobacteriota bacterium]|nr:hypothetical protein [Acidobacteriota bacterium]
MTKFNFSTILIVAPLLLLLCLTGNAQTPSKDTAPDQKAEQVISRAIEVLGGGAYLNIHTVIGHGLLTPYRDGVSQVPMKFVDYIVYPDKERTEFTSNGVRTIQVNFGDLGWIFDGAVKTLNDQKPDQIEEFKFSFKASVETILRGGWRKEGAKLSYVGRREAGLAKRNETVRLTYPDGFWLEYEFAAKEGLPRKIIYMRKHKNLDNGEVEEALEEDRLEKPITIDGITAPFVIDHFIAGKQTLRVSYESIEYNKPVPDSLFAKPASIKGLK